jgi:diacylglycerol kinase family enzyme
MKSALLIVNPASRRGLESADAAERALRRLGVTTRREETTQGGDAGRIAAAQADAHDAVFTVGGDGTAMEVVGALVDQLRPVGILPGGTGNQIARHLKTPLQVERAVRTLVTGREQRIDIARLEDGRRFALTAGFGLDAGMLRRTTRESKRRFGVAAYLWGGLGALTELPKHQVRATVDGVVYERVCGMAMIANVPSLLDGLISTGPGVRTDDGLLDLCLFTAGSIPQALDAVRRCVVRDFRPHPNLLFARGREITLETLPLSEAQADGELLGPVALRAVVEPMAARLLVRAR